MTRPLRRRSMWFANPATAEALRRAPPCPWSDMHPSLRFIAEAGGRTLFALPSYALLWARREGEQLVGVELLEGQAAMDATRRFGMYLPDALAQTIRAELRPGRAVEEALVAALGAARRSLVPADPPPGTREIRSFFVHVAHPARTALLDLEVDEGVLVHAELIEGQACWDRLRAAARFGEARRARIDASDDPIAEPAPGLVVLCEPPIDPVPRSTPERIRALRVERGALASALAAIDPGVSFTLADEREGKVDIRVRATRSAHLHPDTLLRNTTWTAKLLSLTVALTAIGIALGALPAVSTTAKAILGDAEARRRLRVTLGLREGMSLLPEQLVDDALDPASRRLLDGLDTLGEGNTRHIDRLVDVLRAARFFPDESDTTLATARLSIRALLLHYLHETRLEAPVLRSSIDDERDRLDRELQRRLHAIVDHPEMQAFERTLRSLEQLSARHAFDLVLCSRASVLALPSALEAALRRRAPRVIVSLHPLDPRDDAEALLDWAAFGCELDARLLADTSEELAAPLADPLAPGWEALAARTSEGRVLLCPQRVLLREPYGMPSATVRSLRMTEPERPAPHQTLWGSIAMLLAPALAEQSAPFSDAAASEDTAPPTFASGSLGARVAPFFKALSKGPTPAAPPAPAARNTRNVRKPPLRVSIAAPTGDEKRRLALGLVDVHVDGEAEDARLLVPRSLLEPDRPTHFTVEEAQRKAFHRRGMERCLHCGARVRKERHPDGCRFNGDAWGEERFFCTCGWGTLFAFDDDVPIDGYYFYETRFW